MISFKVIIFGLLLIGTQSRVTYEIAYPFYVEDPTLGVGSNEGHRTVLETGQASHRIRRQIGGVMSTSLECRPGAILLPCVSLYGRIPLASNGRNMLSAIGGVNAYQQGTSKYGSATAGLALDNIGGHGLSVTNRHMGGVGDQLTGAAHVSLLNTPDHSLSANAFLTKTMPNNPAVPSFNTRGAGLDYMYRDKIGGSLGAAHTDLIQRTDLSVAGKLNLFKSSTSSVDFNVGATKSMSPFIPKSDWQPSVGLEASRNF